ncbi:helix-turn-helix transcriptional regulator [Dyadobacter chenhuakuii]|uniref:Helix-turn-helix domain-containing protein n=1 Tax=Dyadobacter chenhuakuii TaxID=2909339 RepID=A0ABY4XNU5_9BACT|nr:helix-turn-helix transcriptional regulator [Dyadobacter chenhuakuii]MCF2494610.1 helix-turn-helix domain-containing protein [Dyadobacter chenhuakuii]USJ32068.1 helix-turn-helix domain-containing protein [Dyadobacter chenhuakuii]
MSIVSNNIKYLRRLNGLTQEQFARKIAIKRSLLGAYEEARANPNLTNLKNMAAAFGITVDNLLKNDLRKLRETPDMSLPMNAGRPMTVSHSGNAPVPSQIRIPAFSEPQPLSKIIEKYQQPEPEIRMVSKQVNFKPVNGEPQNQPAIQNPAASALPDSQLPVFNNQFQGSQFNAPVEEKVVNYPTIQWVAKNLQQEYLANFQNPGYLNQLPVFQLPNLPMGYYRAFESGADFAYPGSILVGTFVRNWYDIKDGMQYIFVLRGHGFVYRTAFNQVKTSGMLLLTSDMAEFEELEVPLQDVQEVWEVKAFVSLQLPTPQPSLERVSLLVDELQQELNQYRS